jgi:hypothetical protein
MTLPPTKLGTPSGKEIAPKNGAMSDYILGIYLVLLAGNPAVLQFAPQAQFVGFLIVLATSAVIARVRLRRADIMITCAFALISTYHLVQFSSTILIATLGFMVKLLVALLAARTIRNFGKVYVEILFFLSIMSLLFYLPQQVLQIAEVDVYSMLSNLSVMQSTTTMSEQGIVHIGLHNFHVPSETYRNSGMFWEPGAFAGYLLLGMILLAAFKDYFSLRQYRTRLVLLLVTLITTLSTAGYLVAPFVLALHIPDIRMRLSLGVRVIAAALGAALMAMLSLFAANQLPFMVEKIESQIEEVLYEGTGWETTRFGSAIYDLQYTYERPIAGWSAHPATRMTVDPSIEAYLKASGNGLTGFVVQFGLLGLLVFLISTSRSWLVLFRGRVLRASGALVSTLLLLNGEQFLGFPMFLSLMFIRDKTVPTRSGRKTAQTWA